MARLREIAGEGRLPLVKVRQGGRHELWQLGGARLVIPRHREINELTARGIIARAREVVDG